MRWVWGSVGLSVCWKRRGIFTSVRTVRVTAHTSSPTTTTTTTPHPQEFRAWRAELGPVRVEDIEENLRAGGGKGPFMLTLEYGTEDPAARVPIILLQGMIKCV